MLMFPTVPGTMGGMESERTAQLAELVVARRKARGWPTRQSFADGIDLEYRVLTDLENGVRKLGPKSYAIVENALLWRPGSVDRFLATGDPEELESVLHVMGTDIDLSDGSAKVPQVTGGAEDSTAAEALHDAIKLRTDRFLEAAERRNAGTSTEEDDEAILEFLRMERDSARRGPSEDLNKLVMSNYEFYKASTDRTFDLIDNPNVSHEDRIELLDSAIDMSTKWTDFLIMAAYTSTDGRAKQILPDVFKFRERLETERKVLEAAQSDTSGAPESRKDPRDINVTQAPVITRAPGKQHAPAESNRGQK